MLTANYEKKYVGTYKEIALMFISFGVVLFFLYPKDMLNKQILSEKSNYDLSILYLKNMLRNDSSNENLMLSLAEQSLDSGNKDLSFKLLELLHDTKDKNIRTSAYLLSYRLAKDDYFYLQEHNMEAAKQDKYKELTSLYETMIHNGLYKDKDIKSLYREASFLKNITARAVFVHKLLLKNPQDIQLLSDAYYIARKMKDNKKALAYIDKIIAVDTQNSLTWNKTKFNILLQEYPFNDARMLLKKLAKDSQYWQSNLATFYLYNKQYQNAADVYMKIFKTEKTYAKKKKLFNKALKILQGSNKPKETAKLAYRYEDYFYKDREMRNELLKVYMATGDLTKAGKLSKRMLEGGDY